MNQQHERNVIIWHKYIFELKKKNPELASHLMDTLQQLNPNEQALTLVSVIIRDLTG